MEILYSISNQKQHPLIHSFCAWNKIKVNATILFGGIDFFYYHLLNNIEYIAPFFIVTSASPSLSLEILFVPRASPDNTPGFRPSPRSAWQVHCREHLPDSPPAPDLKKLRINHSFIRSFFL